MKERIVKKLEQLSEMEGFRILHACESGSRAWGFASADSDYDVRFFYAWPKRRYLGIRTPADQYDLGVDEELIDLGGWDLRKALLLFAKSNGALLEWLHSPIVYDTQAEVMDGWRALIPQVYSKPRNGSHYRGLARNTWKGIEEQGPTTTAKSYLYVLRALLASRFALEQDRPPPVEFAILRAECALPNDVGAEIDDLVASKAGAGEKDRISRIEILDQWIEPALEELALKIDALAEAPAPDETLLDEFFAATIEADDSP